MKKGQRDLVILAAFVALGVVFVPKLLRGKGEDPRHDVADDVSICRDRQRAIHRALVAYTSQDEGRLPTSRGPALLAELFASGILEDTEEDRTLMACPGPGAAPLAEGANWMDPTGVGAQHTGYAVRDLDVHPLTKYPTGGEQPFLACDQANGGNHASVLNVLYADGSVRTLHLQQLIEQELLPAGTTALELGPDAALEALRFFPREE